MKRPRCPLVGCPAVVEAEGDWGGGFISYVVVTAPSVKVFKTIYYNKANTY